MIYSAIAQDYCADLWVGTLPVGDTGNQMTINDDDSGITMYAYNANGNLTRGQESGAVDVTTMLYDRYERRVYRRPLWNICPR
jgi:hypothetical protein